MLNLGWPEVVIVLIIAIVIFGPKQLPQLGSSFGKTLKGFKEGMAEKDSEKGE